MHSQSPSIILNRGRDKSLRRLHPWIFSGSVAEVTGNPEAGATVEVFTHEGEWLARAAYSPKSQIRARIWTWDPEEKVDSEFFRRRLQIAWNLRSPLESKGETNAYRIVHAESDGLPGLIVDKYSDWFVLQFLTTGAEFWREQILSAAIDVLECENMYDRSDSSVRRLEGLELTKGVIRGDETPSEIVIHEYDCIFQVDLVHGHKTGFYLDQRENRQLIQNHFSQGLVLNVFAYTGGFTVSALYGNAIRVNSIDSSRQAIELAKQNITLNDLPAERCDWLVADAFEALRIYEEDGLRYDTIYLDPPRFAATSSQAQRAARGYKDINRLAFKLLRSGGTLVTFSCSGGISPSLFQKVVADAALDAGKTGRIIMSLSQPADHPIALTFPEGRYLKGLVVRVE